MTTLCSIGTSHPWNIAGIGLDARVAARLGGRHVAVLAGVSAQGGGVFAAAPIAPALIRAQFEALADAGIDAYRVGLLLDAASIECVAELLRNVPQPVVCDPVLAGSDGHAFVGDDAVRALRSLFGVCTLVTPNLAEASALSGFPVNDRATMAGAAHTLVERNGARAALVTGGHLEAEATDVLYGDGRTVVFDGTRLATSMRGTGCVLATAIAIGLARGDALIDAIERGRALVRDAIAHAAEWDGQRVWPW